MTHQEINFLANTSSPFKQTLNLRQRIYSLAVPNKNEKRGKTKQNYISSIPYSLLPLTTPSFLIKWDYLAHDKLRKTLKTYRSMTYLSESISQLIYPLVIIFLYLTVLVVIAEALNKAISDDPELTRKVVHIGSGNVILLAWWLDIEAKIIVAAAVIAAIIALISYVTPILPSINSVGRKSLGTLFYAVSIGVLAQLFWTDYPQYTAIGILVMAWGDGMAAIIGQRWGQHNYRVFEIKKSWEGSIAMAIATLIVTSSILLFSQGNSLQIWLTALITAVIATTLEAFSKLGLDNLTVPIASGLICYGCYQML